MTSSKRRITVRHDGDGSLRDYESLLTAFVPTVEVDRDVFVREMAAALQVVATSVSNPILTGVRLVAARNTIALTSANGSSTVYQSAFPATTGEKKVEAILPSKDILSILKIFGTGPRLRLGLYGTGRSIVLASEDAIFRLPVLSGQWPGMAHLRTMEFTESVQLSSSLIKIISAAAKVYIGDSGMADVILRPDDDEIVIETRETETGQYRERVFGEISRPYVISIADLEALAKIFDGEFMMDFGATMSRARESTDSLSRQVFILQRLL